MSRKIKTTKQHFETYLDFLKNNKVLLTGKLHPMDEKNSISKIWVDIVNTLNAIGGPIKDENGWKKVFTEWQSNVKKKARMNKQLTEIENEFLTLIGTEVITGLQNVIELGIDKRGNHTENEVIHDEVPDDEPSDQRVEYLENKELITPSTSKNQDIPIQVPIRKRTRKTTSSQFYMYLEYKSRGKNFEDVDFQNLCLNLNNLNGPKHNELEWKKILLDWQNKVKNKARMIHSAINQTGGGMPVLTALNELEAKLLSLLDKVVIFGLPQVLELGLTKKKASSKRSSVNTLINNSINKRSTKKRRTRNTLLEKHLLKIFVASQEKNRFEMLNIVNGLNGISKAIDRFCSICEQNNLF